MYIKILDSNLKIMVKIQKKYFYENQYIILKSEKIRTILFPKQMLPISPR